MFPSLIIETAIALTATLIAPSDNSDKQALPAPEVPESELNATLPTVLGKGRVGGRFLYTTEPRLVTETVSGKGGLPKEERESYVINTLVYFLAQGEPVNLDKLYLNGQKVYDVTSVDAATIASSNQFLNDNLTIFTGAAGQVPSTRLENEIGVGQVPAFNGISYIIIRNLNLGNYGNSYPAVTAELSSITEYPNARLFLQRAVAICSLNEDSIDGFGSASVTFDTNLESIPFRGAVFENAGNNVQSYIEAYTELYQLVLEELVDGTYNMTVPYVPGDTTQNIVNIPVQSILGVDGGDKYTLVEQSKDELPSSLSLDYIDELREMDNNSSTAYNTKTFEENHRTVGIQYVLSRNEAYSGAERLLRAAWSKKKKITFSLPVIYDDRVRIGTKVRFLEDDLINNTNWVVVEEAIGNNFMVEYVAYPLNPILYAYNKSVAAVNFQRNDGESSLATQSNLSFSVLDTPRAFAGDDNRDGVYFVYEVPGVQTTATLYISKDGGVTYESIGSSNTNGKLGSLLDPVVTSDADVTDEINSITVQLNDSAKSLFSVSQTEFENQEQLMVINNEIIAYRDVVDQGNGIYTLTGINRGLSGTEPFIDDHAAGSDVTFLAGSGTGYERILIDNDCVGTVLFKALVLGSDDLDNALSQTVVYEANSAKSLSPIKTEPVYQANGDITLNYEGRALVPSNNALRDNVPLGTNPDGNVFQLDLFNSGTLERTVTVSGQSYTYTLGQQNADIGSAATDLTYDVYQLRQNSDIGRGLKSI